MESGCSFKQNSKSWILSCPRCRKKEKLYIRKTDGRFCCWYCKEIDNFQGRAEYALAELSSFNIFEIKERLYGDKVFESPDDQIVFKPEDFLDDLEEELFREPVLADIFYTPDILPIESPYCKQGLDYLQSRGVDLNLANKYKLMYSPSKRRVIFPVYYENKLFGWQGRYIGQEEFFDDETGEFVKNVKVLTSTGLKKDQTLMFRDNLKNQQHCILCEGPFDGIKADLCGGNVVTMGKAVSKTQLQIIKNSGIKRLYLALDPDAAADVRRIVELCDKDLDLFDMRPTDGRDLGDMSLQEVKRLFDGATKIDSSKIIVYIKNYYEAI